MVWWSGDYKIKSDLIYRAKGCDECSHTGYKGRLVISEVMAINDEIRNLISRSASYSEIRDAARRNEMDTLFESGMKKVENGITSVDEVLSCQYVPALNKNIMPIYSYTVKDNAGKTKTDTVQAHNEDALVDKLQSEGYFIVNIRLAMEKSAPKVD